LARAKHKCDRKWISSGLPRQVVALPRNDDVSYFVARLSYIVIARRLLTSAAIHRFWVAVPNVHAHFKTGINIKVGFAKPAGGSSQ